MGVEDPHTQGGVGLVRTGPGVVVYVNGDKITVPIEDILFLSGTVYGFLCSCSSLTRFSMRFSFVNFFVNSSLCIHEPSLFVYFQIFANV